MKNYSQRLFSFMMVVLVTCNLHGQDSTIMKSKWRFLLEPYIMFPNMHGTTGMGGLPNAQVDENPGDIFKNLQFGVMLYAEAVKGFWTVSSDLTYMKLKSDVNVKNGIVSGTAEVKQLAWELAVMRKLAPWFELGLAFQLNNIKSDVDLFINTSAGPQERTSEIDESW